MPVYGDEKVHHMIRSILPSTARKQFRKAKVALHQTNRSRSHNQLALYKGPASHVIDMYEDDERDLVYYIEPHDGYDSIVWDRRGHDKLNHFVEWAFKRTEHKPGPERYLHMKRMLPDNLIGRHALSHLRDLKWPELHDYVYHFYRNDGDANKLLEEERAKFGASPREQDRSNYYSYKQRQALQEKKRQIKEMVDAILDDKKSLKKFNNLMLSRYNDQCTAFVTKHTRLFNSTHAALIEEEYANMQYDYMESIWKLPEAPRLVKLNHVNKYRFYPVAFAYQDVMKFVLNI